MSRIQVFSINDPLLNFKMYATSYYNCSFYEHDINRKFNIGAGAKEDIIIKEQIITDGKISLERKNHFNPSIIWNNQLIKLDNGLSISITIENASFFVNIVRYDNMSHYEIHVQEGDEKLLKEIMDYIYNKHVVRFETNSIAMNHPGIITLENNINGRIEKEIIDFYNDDTKKKVKSKRRKK